MGITVPLTDTEIGADKDSVENAGEDIAGIAFLFLFIGVAAKLAQMAQQKVAQHTGYDISEDGSNAVEVV